MAGDHLEALPELDQEGNVAKDLFAGAVGGIAQVFVGECSPESCKKSVIERNII